MDKHLSILEKPSGVDGLSGYQPSCQEGKAVLIPRTSKLLSDFRERFCPVDGWEAVILRLSKVGWQLLLFGGLTVGSALDVSCYFFQFGVSALVGPALDV